MDLWVVAVATACAGYLGKYLQNMSLSEKERLLLVSSSSISTQRSSESWNFLQQIRDRTCPLKRLAQGKANYILDINQFGGDADSVLERASTREKVRMVEDINAQWMKNSPKFTARESFHPNMESYCGFCNRKFHKSKPSRGANIEKVEEYSHISAATLGPLLITDGTPLEESFAHNLFDLWSYSGKKKSSHNSFDESEDMPGISGYNVVEDSSRCTSISSSSANTIDYVQSQEHATGQSNEMLLFLIGLTIGMLPTAAANRREAQKMNEKLDQAMTLVQDLKDELAMKDNLTVMELGPQSRTTTPSLFNQELSQSSSEQEPKQTKLDDYGMLDNVQLMSQIEAELEAELERLQWNMDLERTSSFVELHTRSEQLTFQKRYDSDSESEWNEDRSDTVIRPVETPPFNYAVSPRELTIRLHELIESQLQARITELETAIKINQNRSPSPESEC